MCLSTTCYSVSINCHTRWMLWIHLYLTIENQWSLLNIVPDYPKCGHILNLGAIKKTSLLKVIPQFFVSGIKLLLELWYAYLLKLSVYFKGFSPNCFYILLLLDCSQHSNQRAGLFPFILIFPGTGMFSILINDKLTPVT